MKQWINGHCPDLLEIGVCPESYDALIKAVHEAWAAIPQDYIDNLIRGMIDRVKAVLKAKGWQSKYETIDLLQIRAPNLTEVLYLSYL